MGVLIALTALIPIVGAFIGCAVGALLMLVNDPGQALWFIVLFLVLGFTHTSFFGLFGG